jgi:hypothetical protein
LWWIPITKFFANIFVMNVRNKLRLIFPLEMSWKIDHKLLAENCRHFANGPRKNCDGFSLDMYFGNPSPKGWRAFFVSTKNLRDGFILGNKNKKIHHGVFWWGRRAFCDWSRKILR